MQKHLVIRKAIHTSLQSRRLNPEAQKKIDGPAPSHNLAYHRGRITSRAGYQPRKLALESRFDRAIISSTVIRLIIPLLHILIVLLHILGNIFFRIPLSVYKR